jgi:hypothetical protein
MPGKQSVLVRVLVLMLVLVLVLVLVLMLPLSPEMLMAVVALGVAVAPVEAVVASAQHDAVASPMLTAVGGAARSTGIAALSQPGGSSTITCDKRGGSDKGCKFNVAAQYNMPLNTPSDAFSEIVTSQLADHFWLGGGEGGVHARPHHTFWMSCLHHNATYCIQERSSA